MGSEEEKSKKKLDKLEKKRIKAEVKREKKVCKDMPIEEAPTKVKKQNSEASEPVAPKRIIIKEPPQPLEISTVPWYKNPDWVRATAGIASLIVAIIAILITLYI